MLSLDPFYPILPDTEWLARLLPLGVKLVQLRVKDKPAAIVKEEIAKAIVLCRAHGCELAINDYWRDAIEQGARFVHLGQDDLASADLSAIRRAGIRLGVSTHNFRRARRSTRGETRLRRARSDLRDDAQGDAVAAARPAPPR